eukprot:TRINITY_DN3057_c0_g1_i4.p1 TRINITY_DN3057_c0_g1~~TRINITY_DN3057_c0_g1_i4.p1  ORF type:complete len:115 (+),score=7.12 TRINITY_DN3057_c0_g1_i4:467-811(+)
MRDFEAMSFQDMSTHIQSTRTLAGLNGLSSGGALPMLSRVAHSQQNNGDTVHQDGLYCQLICQYVMKSCFIYFKLHLDEWEDFGAFVHIWVEVTWFLVYFPTLVLANLANTVQE